MMMGELRWPEHLNSIWAKAAMDDEKVGESLPEHTYFVLQMAGHAYSLRRHIPYLTGADEFWNILFWSCWFHDFGKSSPSFQSYLRGQTTRWGHRHEVLSLVFLKWIEDSFEEDEFALLCAAVAYHHKDREKIHTWYSPPDPDECLGEIFAGLDLPEDETILNLYRWIDMYQHETIAWAGFPEDAGVKPVSLLCEREALRVVKDDYGQWILEYLKKLRGWHRESPYGPYGSRSETALLLKGIVNWCDYTASAHVESCGFEDGLSLEYLEGRLDAAVFDSPYNHQKQSSKVDSAVLIAPTGSGKTEASLIWACSQPDRGYPVSRIIYMLPYQASMNAMHARLDKVFPGYTGLEHGRSTLALYRQCLDEGAELQKAINEARIQSKLSRLHCYPVRVTSPYQMLKGPYRLKGYELLLSDFVGATVILDEIHAYEVERLAKILATVEYLQESMGTRVFIMSATLPGILIQKIQEILDTEDIIRADPETFAKFTRHQLECVDGDLLEERWLEEVCEKAKQGVNVLVCCNTVSRTQEAYEYIKEASGTSVETILLHGRFTGADRLEKEKRIQELVGSGSEKRGPVVVVSTQVVEVSLDIDLDECYTDPAPLDALVQRFGRVNRRKRRNLAPVKVFTLPDDGQGIYDPNLVQASVEIVRRNCGRPINEQEISSWLDEIYSGEIASKWNREFEESYSMFRRSCIETMEPFASDPNAASLFYKAFDGVEVVPSVLAQEYERLYDSGNPLEASALTVPVSWKQYLGLVRKGLVNRDSDSLVLDRSGKVPVVELPYSKEYGMKMQGGMLS